MSETPLLQLPLLEAGQAQKHVTHNEALLRLDALIQLSVISRSVAVPPGTPVDGDRYLLGASPTGLWSGHGGEIAARQAGSWIYYPPRKGWRLWVEDEDALLAYNGTAWIAQGGGSGTQNVPLVGVNTTADTSNRLSVSSPAVLLNHDGNGVQLKVNKNAATDTGSLLFQTGFSGRAEMGLSGDDDLHFKVSPNGSTWTEAIVIDRSTGAVSLPATPGLGVSDGNKGDITVSSAGGNWAVNVNSVSTAKLGGDVTALGKSLVSSADAAAARATLGLGTLATQNGTLSGTNTGDQVSATVPFTPAGNVTATTVQAAVEQLDGAKVSKSGDAMTGKLTVTRTGTSWAGAANDPFLFSQGSVNGVTTGTAVRAANVFNINSDAVDASSANGNYNGYFGHVINSSSAKGHKTALAGVTIVSGTTGNTTNKFYTPVAGIAQATVSDNGTAPLPNGSLFGGFFSSSLLAGATNWSTACITEFDIECRTGSAPKWKTGIQVVQRVSDVEHGIDEDVGYLLANQTGGTAPGWRLGFGIGSPHGDWPIDPAGTIIGTQASALGGPSYAAAKGIDFSAVTFSSSAFKSTGFDVSPAGVITGSNLSGTNTGDQTAATVAFTPAGGIASSTVQAALVELDAEKEAAGTAASVVASHAAAADPHPQYLTQPEGDARYMQIGGGGSGDVAGPASAADNAIARYDGATGKILQNSAILLNDDGSLRLPDVATPAAPAAGTMNLFAMDLAGRDMLGTRVPAGPANVMQVLMGRSKIGYWSPPGNGNSTPGVFGFATPTALGTATARNVATASLFTRMRRLGYVSAATAGSLSGHYSTVAQFSIGDGAGLGGFLAVFRFGVSDAATVSGARMFVGMRNATSAPTNAEPNTLTNALGVAQLSTSTNLQIVYGGSAAQTAIDLGANFPASTLSADAYELTLYAPSNAQVVGYRVERLNTGHVATGTLSGTAGTAIPAAATLLGHTLWRCNNATALAVGIDIASFYVETDY